MTNPNEAPYTPRYRTLAFLLPILLFSLVGALEPSPNTGTSPQTVDSTIASDDDGGIDSDAGGAIDQITDELDLNDSTPTNAGSWVWPLPPSAYPWVFFAKIVITSICVAYFWPFYVACFPLKVNSLAVVVGVVGFVLWVGLWMLDAESYLLDALGGPESSAAGWLGLGERPAYNPLAALGNRPSAAWLFLAVRFIGLVLLVPIIEELFLRAFFMRYIMHDTWWEIPFGDVNRLAVIAGIALPVLYHPEKLSALVWFSLVTWLMIRTRNFWDCVVAHAVTNLLLGIYVVALGEWELW